MHQYFKKQFDLVLKFKVALGSFLGQGENKYDQIHRKKVISSCSRMKIVSTAVILVLKLAHKEYQRKRFSFSVKKDEESVFLGQKQTKMEFRRSSFRCSQLDVL